MRFYPSSIDVMIEFHRSPFLVMNDYRISEPPTQQRKVHFASCAQLLLRQQAVGFLLHSTPNWCSTSFKSPRSGGNTPLCLSRLTLRNTGTHRLIVFRPSVVFGLARLKLEKLCQI